MSSSLSGRDPGWLGGHKAGMGGDVEKQRKIVAEFSAGSVYKETQDANFEKNVKPKLDKIVEQLGNILPMERKNQILLCQMKIETLEQERSFLRHFVVLDFDFFYVQVELLSRPDLKEKPCIVGSGVVLTSNYVARTFGVRSAMPVAAALKLCAGLEILEPNFAKYEAVSKEMQLIVAGYDPNFECHSLDEAKFDLTDYCRDRLTHLGRTPTVEEMRQDVCLVVSEIRAKIYVKTGVTSSAGISNNLLTAKACSNINKPNGQYSAPIDRDNFLAFVGGLKLRDIGGIGPVWAHIISELGWSTLGNVRENLWAVNSSFPVAVGKAIFMASLGMEVGEGMPRRDNNALPQTAVTRKSFSLERTFGKAVMGPVKIKDKVVEIGSMLAEKLKEYDLQGKSLMVRIRRSDFVFVTRAAQHCNQYLTTAEDIIQKAWTVVQTLLADGQENNSIRLFGITISGFRGYVDTDHFHETGQTIDSFFIPAVSSPSSSSSSSSSSSHHHHHRGGSFSRGLAGAAKADVSAAIANSKLLKSPSPRQKKPEVVVASASELWVCFICGKHVPIDTDNVEINCHLNRCLIINNVVAGFPAAASSKKKAGTKRKREGEQPSSNTLDTFLNSPPRAASK